jgi:UDP-N-acetylmuramyl pentapeptide phosphotransferase/UDP-N-acetylglucosamine-1-phosphate transferase
MGTGALALGAALGTIADRAPEIVLAIMVDFVVEALSVMLQGSGHTKALRHRAQTSKMAPLHHHFESDGKKRRRWCARSSPCCFAWSVCPR